jgi:predicted kinase
VLLVLNGAPGVGKSALAERYARDHALTLVVEIDDLRRRLGQWETTDATKAVARELALALVADHLGRGSDVVVPQFLGRREFADRLRGVAEEAGARFVEVVLVDEDDAVIARFRARRAALAASGRRHPEADLAEHQVAPTICAANAGLRRDAAAHDLPLIPMDSGIDAAYAALLACVE